MDHFCFFIRVAKTIGDKNVCSVYDGAHLRSIEHLLSLRQTCKVSQECFLYFVVWKIPVRE